MALALASSACQVAEPLAGRPAGDPTAADDGTTDDGAGGGDAGPTTASGSEEEAPAEPGGTPGGAGPSVAACGADDLAEIDEVVGAQLADLRAGDFDAALGWATPAFRATRSAPDFAALITDGFPELLQATAHEVTACAAADDQAIAAVTVEGPGGALDLQYLMASGTEGWRIDGAAPVTADGGPADGPVI